MVKEKKSQNIAEEPLLIKKNRWSQRQLLKNILSRYFDIIDDAGGIWPSWIVKLEESEDPHLALENLNKHLEKLDWMAKLDIDEPYCVKIYPKPTGIFDLSNNSRILMWILATLSVWSMGTYWIYNLSNYDSYLNKELLMNSLIMYALPLIVGLWIASKAQILISKEMGMRVGGILPILLPIPLPSWPFGIAAIPSHPRMESMPWADRKRIGIISIIAPLVMIFIGFIYLMIGLFITQTNTPELISAPTKINLPFLAEILSILIIGEDKANLIVNWIHPLGLAGMFLLTTGWICMLPFPTLPGGRALVAIMGSKSAKSSSTQIWLFFVLFLVGMFYSIFEGSSFWTFVVIAGIMLVFFHGSDERIPMLLDDIKPLKDETKSKLSVLIIFSLLMALPAEYPLEQIESWDSELITEWNEIYEIDPDSEFRISLSVYNPSLKDLEWSMNIWTDMTHVNEFNLSVECPNNNIKYELNCNSTTITPYTRETIFLIGNTPNINNISSIVNLYIGFEQMGDIEFSKVTLNPKTPIKPTSPYWKWNGGFASPIPVLCVNLSIERGLNGKLIADEMWQITKPEAGIISENIVSNSVEEVCLSGKEGLLQIYSVKEKPSVNLKFNSENLNMSWDLFLPNNLTKLTSGEKIWNLHQNITNTTHFKIFNMLGENSNIQYSIEGEGLCNYEMWATYPEVFNNTYILDFNDKKSLLIPSINNNQTLDIKLPKEGTLLLCENNNPYPSKIWEIVSGPNLVMEMNEEYLDWIGKPLVVIGDCSGCNNLSQGEVNITLTNGGNTSLELKKELHGPSSVFEVFDSPKLEIGPGENTQISLKWNLEDGEAYLVSWMEVDSAGEIILHLSMISK